VTDDHHCAAHSYLALTLPSHPFHLRSVRSIHGPSLPPSSRIPQSPLCRLGQPWRSHNPRHGHGPQRDHRPVHGRRNDESNPVGHHPFHNHKSPELGPINNATFGHALDHNRPQINTDPQSSNEGQLNVGSVWWYVARSSGLVAWGLAALSVLWGLLLSTKVMGTKARPNWLLDLHRFLGGLTVVFIAVHLVGLFLDPYVNFSAAQLFIPFASSWKPSAVAWGIVALYLLLAVEITSLLRRRIPKKWWKAVHMSSYGISVFGTVHLLTAGTDRHSPLLLWTVTGMSGAVAAMTLYRIVTPKETRTIQSDTIRSAQPIG